MKNLFVSACVGVCLFCGADVMDELYDVVVVGGTSYAVSAAVAARSVGARVFVAAPRGYLGEDVAGKYRLVAVADDDDSHPLYESLWTKGKVSKPLAIKKALDNALLERQIAFRTWMPTVDVAKGKNGEVAGIVVWTRNGRRTIRAKCVIDATERAWVSRRAGAEFAQFPAGDYAFVRHVVSGEQPQADGMEVRDLGRTGSAKIQKRLAKENPDKVSGRLWECTMKLPMKDGSALSFAAAEQIARDRTWTRLHLEGADTMVMLAPPDRLVKAAEGVFTAGPLAGDEYAKPGRALVAAEALGRKVAAAAAAKQAYQGEVAGTAAVPPTVAECDVLVAGLGTGGAPAMIAAARRGAKTMGFEWSYKCGGLTTDGMIGSYWYGNCVGFTEEIDRNFAKEGVVYVAAKEQWFRREARKAGAEIVFGSFVAGAIVEGGRIAGATVVFWDGSCGVVRCRTAVDATGNSDLAAAAGEETEFINADELSLQGAAFTRKSLGASCQNVDFSFINDTDAEDLWYISLRGRASYQDTFWDQSQVIDSRERRRIRGVARVSPQDVMLSRTYPDTVCVTRSNFDTHGQTVDPQFFIEPPPHNAVFVNLPYRALQPKKTDNLLVIGLGLSAHRDAMPILRMEPDVQNQGFVAGSACALALQSGKTTRTLDVKALQKLLVEKGVVPEAVLTAKDSFPLSDETLAEAVNSLSDKYKGLAAVFAEPERALPLLRAAYDRARSAEATETRLVYAHVLAFLGDARGVADLAEKVRSSAWDDGWHYRGMGQFGRSVSWVDSYIIALGRTKSRAAFEAVAEKARELTAEDPYSHHRAVAMALEHIGDRAGAEVLWEIMRKPGITSHAFLFSRDGAPAIAAYDRYNFSGPGATKGKGGNSAPDRERSACLRELALARALYRLGDIDGTGEKILREYAADPRRAYAEHASKVLGAAR